MQQINTPVEDKNSLLTVSQVYSLLDRSPKITKVLYLTDRKLVSYPEEEIIKIYKHPNVTNLVLIGHIERAALSQLFDDYDRENPLFTVEKIEELLNTLISNRKKVN